MLPNFFQQDIIVDYLAAIAHHHAAALLFVLSSLELRGSQMEAEDTGRQDLMVLNMTTYYLTVNKEASRLVVLVYLLQTLFNVV